MSGKPITTDLNNGDDAPTDILTDLRSAGGGGGAQNLGDLGSTAKPSRRVSMQTLVLALVLVASGASLYMMRKQGMQGGLKFNKVTVAPEIEKVSAATSAAEVRILADLARSSMPATSDAERLQKNPFLLDTPAATPTAAAVPVAQKLNDDRQAMIREKLAGVRLNGVMQGPVPLARINERLMRVGDLVEDIFLVAQIHDRSVDLIADGQTFTINMGEGVSGNATRKSNGRTSSSPGQPR